MTRKLEELFDLVPTEAEVNAAVPSLEENRATLTEIDAAIDKIDAALPAIKGLDATDSEMDELSDLAKSSYNDLMDLGMQVDSRFASEIFSVASNMLGHAITAKTAKLDKKLKMIDLQMKKLKMDQVQEAQEKARSDSPIVPGTGTVLSGNRNDILAQILASNNQKAQKE
jgi:hypothetical protein